MKTNFSKKQSEYWDGYTKDVEILDLNNLNRAEKIELSFFLKLLGNIKNKKILDLGCGTGRWGLQLAKNAKEVVGIDISKHSIQVANRTAKKNGIANFTGVVNDFKSADFEDEFDIVVATNLIHHADNIEEILDSVHKSLKKNGRLVIFEINSLNPLYYPFFILIGQLRSHLTLEYWRSNIFSLKRLLTSNRFRVAKVYRWCFLPTMLYNYSLFFKKLNEFLNKIPLINTFCAFHVINCVKR